MTIKLIAEQLNKKGIPPFWQLYVICLATISIPVMFIPNNNWLYATNIVIHSLIFIGVYVGQRSHKEKKRHPRLLLVNGTGLIILAKLLQSLTQFNIPINPDIPFLVEELGITLITIFAFIHLLMFEEKFKIKGLTIDYSLLITSFLFFFLLISPNLLNTLWYETSLYQKLLILNVFIGSTLLSMSAVHYFLSKSMGLTDSIRIILTILLVIHFSLETLISFDLSKANSIISGLSLSTYHLAGSLAILFIFIEKLSLNYSPISPSRLGNQFMWIASITAIIAIPLGLIIRSLIDAPSLDLLAIGLASIFISIIVIWRFIILIKNSNLQRTRLKSLMQTNALTELPNYQGYLEKLTLSQLKNVLVININIDDFKAINDLYGRDSGDDVLKSLAKRLSQLPDIVFLAHTHSDLFLAIFQTKESNIKRLLKATHETLGVWDNIQGKKITVPITCGTSYCNGIAEPERLAKQAEYALKTARSQHASFSLYTEKLDNKRLPRHEIRDILQQSVDSNHLPVHFQPIYNLKDGSLKALELLIRVDTKEHGLLLPGQFLDQAKAYGLLTSLTQVCIKMVAKHYAVLPDVVININLPPYMLKSSKLLNNFIQLFEEEALPPKKFCIEITEDEDIPTTALIPAVRKLKACGFSIAMDDFGTGYSSLDKLSVLDVDTVKIDRSLLLSASSGSTEILEWAISLTKRLRVSVVVEGVETIEQLALVKLLGADSVQGFIYSKPVPILQTNNIALNSNDIRINMTI